MTTFESIPTQVLTAGMFAGQTSENDLQVDAFGNLLMTNDLIALLNVIRCAVQTNMGELQYNVNKGVPHLQTIFSNPSLEQVWKSYLQSTIEAIDGVISVQFIETEFDHQKSILTYTTSIITIYGTGEINGGTLQLYK